MRATPESCPGILSLRLQTSRLDALKTYYAETLGLPIIAESANELIVAAGGTRITFEAIDAEAAGDPYYHVAFNIPENKLAAAKSWLKPRCPLLKRPDGTDEYDFRSWNAHAIYFLDPAGNILEFIARHDLKNATDGEFSPADILYASEIALVVDDVGAMVDASKASLGLAVFGGSQSEHFAAVGNDHRLLILVQRGRPWLTQEHRRAMVFPTQAVIRGERALRLPVGELPHDVSSE